MGVICFASMKGGVGKTSAAVNVAHALATRGCETLLIDLDPTGHASRYFKPQADQIEASNSPLVELFASSEMQKAVEKHSGYVDAASSYGLPLLEEVRSCLNLLSAAPELRCFLVEEGKQVFTACFPELIAELESSFDCVVIDTPPDFNSLTQAGIAAANLVVVPIDSSALSIKGMEQLINAAAGIEGPNWSILRTMVTRKASRVRRLSEAMLSERISECADASPRKDYVFRSTVDSENVVSVDFEASLAVSQRNEADLNEESPIFLLNTVIYRTEEQNRLSYNSKTAFEARSAAKLAAEYYALAKELEDALVVCEEYKSCKFADDFLDLIAERM